MKWSRIKNEWFSDDNLYQVAEVTYASMPNSYHCFRLTEHMRYKFIGFRSTPEDARKFCEIHSGEL
jgi:hypothetical protein